MGDSLLDRVMKAKKDYEVGQFIYFNSGRVSTETNGFAKKMDDIWDKVEIELLMRDLCEATASYARQYPLDTMIVGLDLGLIYKADDIDENMKPKAGAKPVNNIVRYYDTSFDSYADGKKTNEREFGEHNVTHQGYVHYDKLVKVFHGSGVEFTGPKTFEEFKKAIEAGEVFDINLIAEMNKKEQTMGSK